MHYTLKRQNLRKLLQGDQLTVRKPTPLATLSEINSELQTLESRKTKWSFEPDATFFVELLKRCARVKNLEQGRRVHWHVVDRGFQQNFLVAGHLMHMYSQCGSVIDVEAVFHSLESKSIISWTRLIGAYCHNGYFELALAAFYEMQEQNMVPTKVTYCTILNACTTPEALEDGVEIHRQISERKYDTDIFVGTALVNMYNKCGSVTSAWEVFKRLSERDVVSWTAMITSCVQHGQHELARYLYRRMQHEGVLPNAVTFFSIFNAFGREELSEGKFVFGLVRSLRLESDVRVMNSAVNMFGNAGELGEARYIFLGMQEKDVVTWNIVITLYAQRESFQEAGHLYRCMQLEGTKANTITFVSALNVFTNLSALREGRVVHGIVEETGDVKDTVVATALMNLYGKCGSPGQAWKIFMSMERKDSVAWTVMCVAYAQNGFRKESLDLFQEMQLQGLRPTGATLVGVLDTCAHLAALHKGRQIHSHLVEDVFRLELVVETAIINMYGKCGKLVEAFSVFNQMKSKDILTWNSMLGAYAQHGHYDETLQLFNRMQLEGVSADNVTFVSVLSALSHSGSVTDGYSYFVAMTHDFSVTPTAELCGCVVDLLGRAGKIQEAVEFIQKLSGSLPEDGILWMTLLAACRTQNKMEHARAAAERVLERYPGHSGAYVVLSNLHGASGDWEAVKKLRSAMHARGVKREPGRSTIEILNKVHEFVERESWHPRREAISAELERLEWEMRGAGYVPDSKKVLHDVGDEQEENLLCLHSEKIAIAFGVISTPPGTPLRVIKNSRVCSDCHTVTKFISKLRGREILLRDAHRFHNFKDGACSCKDYW